MTDKEKLLKLRKLADAMYYATQHLTTDASRLHKAMDEYHQFIINEYHKKEPTIPDIVDEHFYEMLEEEPVSEELEEEIKKYLHEVYDRDTTVGDVARHFAKWQKQRMMKDAITATILPANLEETEFCLDDYDEVKHITRLVKEENLKIGDKVKVIVIKEE